MQFELVEFYPITEKSQVKDKNLLGTIHLYIIDYNFDLRGIRVIKRGKNILFFLPHILGFDHESGERMRYPVFSFTNKKDHEDMMDFLHKEVKPVIQSNLKPPQGSKN